MDSLYFLGLAQFRIAGLISPFQIINGLLLLAMLSALPGHTISTLVRRNVLSPILLLSIYAIVSCGISPYPQENIIDGVQMFFLYVTFVSTLEFRRQGWLSQRWVRAVPWVIISVIISSQALGLLFGITVGGAYAHAAAGIAGRPGSVGAFAVSVVPWFLVFSQRGTMGIAGAVLAFAVAVSSMRRNAFVVISTVLTLMVVYLISHTPRSQRRALLIGITGVVCLVFASFLFYTTAGQAFVYRLHGLNVYSGGTAGGRTEFMVVAWDHLLSRGILANLLGEGSGAIADIMEASWGGRIGAHNGWLDITTAFGTIGFICLLWFHINVLRMYLHSRASDRTIAFGAAVTVWIAGVFMDGLYGPSSAAIYAVLGLVAARTSRHCPIRADRCPTARSGLLQMVAQRPPHAAHHMS